MFSDEIRKSIIEGLFENVTKTKQVVKTEAKPPFKQLGLASASNQKKKKIRSEKKSLKINSDFLSSQKPSVKCESQMS